MSTNNNHVLSIERGIDSNTPHNEIVRKVFLSYPTHALVGEEDRQYAILNSISKFFSIPIMSIQVAGSAKTGKSFYQNKDFTPGESDLDIAIIDSSLFIYYMELVFDITNGYSNKANFPLKDGRSTASEYISYISKGIFRPDLMPHCPQKANWRSFFGTLSRDHNDLFKSINAGLYMSQTFFEYKQNSTIQDFIKNRAI